MVPWDLGLTGIGLDSGKFIPMSLSCRLDYSKVSMRQARWVLVGREDSPYQKIARHGREKKISTE